MKPRSEVNEALERAGHALRSGEISENEFVRRTAERWRRTAKHLFTRWRRKLPSWVEAEDVEHELVLLALGYDKEPKSESARAAKWAGYVRSWDPSKGTSLASYVTWCCIHRAQRKMDHWRGASLSGNSGKNPGRHELTFSRVTAPDGDDPGTRVPGESEDPLDRIESGESFDRVMARCETVRQALVMMALRATRGDVEKAAETLHRNFRSRIECDLESEEHASEVVRDVVEELHGICRLESARVMPPDDLFVADEDAA